MTLASLVVLLAASAFAHPEHDGAYRPAPKPAAAPAPATVIPATYPEVVAALRERATATETAIDGFKIADVHKACTNATDLALALPGKAAALSAEAQATVATTTTHLEEQLAALVARADKGDMVAAKAALALVRIDLDTLEALAKNQVR